jgi:predicted glycosyltransferase
MRSIIFDITHLPHINLFKNAIRNLVKAGNKVHIVCLDRGKNFNILKKELPFCEITKIGKHRGNMFSIIFEANIFRFFLLVQFLQKRKFDIGLSAGSFILGFALKLFRIPNIQFYDDPENTKNMYLQLLSSDGLFYPPFKNLNKNINVFNCLKEWAYLSPNYFIPDIEQLKKYILCPKKYIFVREVSVGSSNYLNQKTNLISKISNQFPPGFKVLLSLENKENRNLYPISWILLEEPIDDIYSLIYYSKLLISSGDSMAREAAILGVPSIYCGIRNMRANDIMIRKNILFHKNIDEVSTLLNEIINDSNFALDQEKFREDLLAEWDDMTIFILEKINNYRMEAK